MPGIFPAASSEDKQIRRDFPAFKDRFFHSTPR
jgi:hypothetical protein